MRLKDHTLGLVLATTSARDMADAWVQSPHKMLTSFTRVLGFHIKVIECSERE